MRPRRVRSVKAASSFRSLSRERILEVFLKVRDFIHRKTGRFGRTSLRVPCQEIDVLRRTKRGYVGGRSFMHVGHVRNTVCSVRPAAALSDGHLVGLLLHEFGHLGGGHDEPPANAWIRNRLGIEILYKGPLDLQWVSPEVVFRILG